MYLATEQQRGVTRYRIRISVQTDKDLYASQTVFDLGPDPCRFFNIVAEHCVIFDDALLSALQDAEIRRPADELEKLLFAFFPQDVQQRLLLFRDRGIKYKGPLSPEEKEQIQRQVHIVDKRRLYYLRYGAVDQSRLYRLNEKCCRPLIGQSRDEREYYFREQEKVLEPGMYLQYVYAIFNLCRHFQQSFASWLPEALPRDEIGRHLKEALRLLQLDTSFWQAEKAGEQLHPHLQHYLWMLRNFVPRTASFQQRFAEDFIAGRRQFKWPERKTPTASPEKFKEIWGVSREQLQAMSQRELTRLYRKKALELHPDKGGDAELFIVMREIYTALSKK
ncbi:MAG: hypothetical protein CSB23_04375 [Deltaproteobacteria bacterium]|nr:MAG: hypothetical protein CSB23_04375 [Deltaproteobacteria bacterium]